MGNSSSRRRSQTQQQVPSSTLPNHAIDSGPTGLYQTCEWDQKIITRLIVDKKLAPRHKGTSAEQKETEECPICFLNYTSFNQVNCCNNCICTECYLQVKSPKGTSTCPFCNNSNFGVTYNSSKRQNSSTSVATPPSSPPSANSSPTPLSTPSSTSDSSKSMSPSVMSTEARRLLEREMATQRADHITSEQYAESRYRSASWGSRNEAPPTPARRGTFGTTRSVPRRDRTTRRGDNRRATDGRLRSEFSEEDYYDYAALGPPQRIDPSIYQEILAESQTPAQEEELNILNPESGMSLQQLEEMMIREAIRLSMAGNGEGAVDNTRLSPPPPVRESAQPPPPPTESLATEIADNTSVENIDFGDDEEAMLEYALTLSRQLSQPATPLRNSGETNALADIEIMIPENRVESHDPTLSPSALRLLDLIEEALSIPSHQPESSESSSSSSSSGGNQGRYGSFSSHSSTDI